MPVLSIRQVTSRFLSFAVCLSVSGLPARAAQKISSCRDDAMLVFDASRSMTNVSNDSGGRPRIDEARNALRDVLPDVTPFRDIGLIVYGPGRQDVCGHIDLRLLPTQDAHARIMAEVEQIVPDGDTPLTQAVSRAADVLQDRSGPGAIVLITDGRETCGGTPCELADRLALKGDALVVHVIGFRTLMTSFEWQSFGDDANRNTTFVARCLADRTNGIYASAQSTDDLVAALQDILACPVVSKAGPIEGPHFL